MREIAHAQKRNRLSDLDEILQDGRFRHFPKFKKSQVTTMNTSLPDVINNARTTH